MAVVPERGCVTLAVQPRGLASQTAGPASPGVAPPEAVQPVFTRYWLHGKGPAPAGNLPVAVHLSPARLMIRAGDIAPVRLTVACGPAGAAGTVTVDGPADFGVTAVPSGGPAAADAPEREPAGKLRYQLAANDFAGWDLAVAVPAGTLPGRYFLAACILDDAGQLLEDAILIEVGEVAAQAAGLPADELGTALERISAAEAAEAELTMLSADLELPPGGSGEIAVRLSSGAATELRGEAQLISPHGSWASVPNWMTGFSADPGGEVNLRFPVTIPPDARPGQRWWALVKVMYFGRLGYSEPIWVSVGPARSAPIG
jgi:hypothetical protein